MSTQKIQLFLFLLLFSCGFTYAAEYTVETVPNMQKADARRFVSNPDGILGPQAESLINTRLDSLRQNTTAEIAVVAVESIGEQDLESFSNELFARWGIGQKENNNGVLVLFVLDQRKIRFEVGYGMEGILPDAVCKRIQSQYMLPAFRQGDYDLGMVQGINRMCSIIENPGNREEVYANATVEEGDWLFLIEMYLGLSVLFSIVMMLMMRTPQQGGTNPSARYKALENQLPTLKIMAVIFPLFNLFIYLSVRNRMYKLRNAKRTCENCGHSMHKLNEEEDNKFLTSKENAEEIAQSVDYDVWLCDNDRNLRLPQQRIPLYRMSPLPCTHIFARKRSGTISGNSFSKRIRRKKVSLPALPFRKCRTLYPAHHYRSDCRRQRPGWRIRRRKLRRRIRWRPFGRRRFYLGLVIPYSRRLSF